MIFGLDTLSGLGHFGRMPYGFIGVAKVAKNQLWEKVVVFTVSSSILYINVNLLG